MPVVVTNCPTSGEVEPLPWICAIGVVVVASMARRMAAAPERPRASPIVPVRTLKPGAPVTDDLVGVDAVARRDIAVRAVVEERLRRRRRSARGRR